MLGSSWDQRPLLKPCGLLLAARNYCCQNSLVFHMIFLLIKVQEIQWLNCLLSVFFVEEKNKGTGFQIC